MPCAHEGTDRQGKSVCTAPQQGNGGGSIARADPKVVVEHSDIQQPGDNWLTAGRHGW